MFPLLLTDFILVTVIAYYFPTSHPLLLPNQCNEKCGELKIPFPFHLNSSCASLSNAFQLSCTNSTTLFLGVSSESYRVLEFYSDGVLVDFSSSSCRQYNDLNSFGFEGNDHLGVSDENVVGLYDCEDSSLCKAVCEAVDLPGCEGGARTSSPACCYPLSDHSVWRFGDKFSVFAKFGCRGFSSWAVGRAASVGKRGVKLEWAVPKNSSRGVCASNGYVVNATAVKRGVRCLCQEGYVGDGFANGKGCIKSCIKDRKEVYGNECNKKKRSDKKLLIMGGILSGSFIVASFIALFCLLKRPAKSGEFDSTNQDNFHSDISLRKACRTRLFTYRELEAATKGFEDGHKLVQGLNGTIYVGTLFDGSHIAVHKIRCNNERDLIQVLSQIEVLSSVIHRNLACLLGCCIDMPYMPLVVYEYPPNGTLEEHLHQRREPKTSLDWPTRLSIAAETASVLSFLQYEISPPIFHCDLKSSSIFLYENLSVKVAGFALLANSHKSLEKRTTTTTTYTPFQKNDVTDLGILLLEIIAGSSNRSLDFPTLALQKIRKGKLEEIVDPLLYYHEQPGYRCEQIENVADLATRCLLFGGDGKLGMVDVARELGHIAKEHGADGGGSSKRRPALEETFSNSSLLQMISMSPDSIYLP